MFLIRFVFYFVISFFILCIPVGDGLHLFDKLYGLATPYADKAIKSTKQKLTSTKKYSRKLYSNSEPVELDEVKNKAAAVVKKQTKRHESQNSESQDTYTAEEKIKLMKVLNDKE